MGVSEMSMKVGCSVICRRSMSVWRHTLVGTSYEDCRLMFHVAILVWVVGTGWVWVSGRVGWHAWYISPCTCGCGTGGWPLGKRGVGGVGRCAGSGVRMAAGTLGGLTIEVSSSGGVSDWRMVMITLRMWDAVDG